MLIGRWITAAVATLLLPVLALGAMTGLENAEGLPPDQLQTLRALVTIVFLFSAGVLVVTAVIAFSSRGNYTRIARLFRPGMMLLLVGLVVLLPLQFLLLAVVLTSLISAAGFIAVPIFLFSAAGGVAVAVVGIAIAAVSMLRAPVSVVPALALERSAAPELFAEVERIARTLGTEPPDQILATLEPTFFVTEVTVEGLDGKHRGRTLALSPAFSRMLTRAELRAVLGHEMGHFRGGETRYSGKIGPAFVAATRAYQALGATAGSVGSVGGHAASVLLGAYFETFATREAGLSRDRELGADQAGASVATPEELITALAKISATFSGWEPVFNDAVQAVHGGRGLRRLVASATDKGRQAASRWRPTSAREVPHPWDRHPPFAERAAALGVDTAVAERAVADLDPADHGATVFTDLDALDDRLTRALETKLRERLGVTVPIAGSDDGRLRAAAETDRHLADILAVIEEAHGDLVRPERRPGRWVALADLTIVPHPTASMADAALFVERLLPDLQDLAVGLAGPGSKPGIRKGAELDLIGYNVAGKSGAPEDLFVARVGLGVDVFAVRGLGDVPVDHQLAGLMVVPVGDPLAKPDGELATRLSAAIAAYLAARAT